MKRILGSVLLAGLAILTGCTYSAEERREMVQYREQGEENALVYVQEKYGFSPTVTDVACEKGGGGAFDFTPPPTGRVFVTMEQAGQMFCVGIAGDAETTEGVDNYQYAAIKTAVEQRLEELGGCTAEEIFLCYGKYDTLPEDEKNGMIASFFDGENLTEVLAEQYPTMVAAYINQDIAAMDMELVKAETGLVTCLLVDYVSQQAYKTIETPYFNISGTPIESDIEQHLLCMNGYRKADYGEDTYVHCKARESHGMLYITDEPDVPVVLTEATMSAASEWNGRGFLDAKQVFPAYALATAAKHVELYIPVELLDTTRPSAAEVVMEYVYGDGETGKHRPVTELTDDGTYLHASISTKDRTDIRFTVLVDQR